MTAAPDPRSPDVLKGCPEAGSLAEYRLDLGSMLVRNVTTDTRALSRGGHAGRHFDLHLRGGGLCIGHPGHLHRIPSEEQYAAIGRLD